MSSRLVRNKAKNTGSYTVEQVEKHYWFLQVGPGGRRVGVQNVFIIVVHRMRQRLARFLPADRICMTHVEWEPGQHCCNFPDEEVTEIPTYSLLGHSVLNALIDQK